MTDRDKALAKEVYNLLDLTSELIDQVKELDDRLAAIHEELDPDSYDYEGMN